mgnify:CR=1 FL=1
MEERHARISKLRLRAEREPPALDQRRVRSVLNRGVDEIIITAPVLGREAGCWLLHTVRIVNLEVDEKGSDHHVRSSQGRT